MNIMAISKKTSCKSIIFRLKRPNLLRIINVIAFIIVAASMLILHLIN